MSEQTVADLNQPHEGSTPPAQDLPTPPALDAIKKQIIRNKLEQHGLVEPDENPRSVSLSPDQKKQDAIIDAAVINSHQLGAWLDARGLLTYSDGIYTLAKDPSANIPGHLRETADSRVIDLTVTTPEFNLSYQLFRNNEFGLSIDFPALTARGAKPYTVERKSVGDLTLQEAEIIGFYALNFLDTAVVAQKPAA